LKSPVRLLDFVNAVRALQGREPVDTLPLVATEADDDRDGFVAVTLGCEAGDALDPEWSAQDRWVLRFSASRDAEDVAAMFGLPLSRRYNEVMAPADLVDLMVSEHFGLVEADDEGFVRGWWVPIDGRDAVMEWRTPRDEMDLRPPPEPTGGRGEP